MKYILFIAIAMVFSLLIACETPVTLYDLSTDKVVIDLDGAHFKTITDDEAQNLTQEKAQKVCGAYDKEAVFLSLDGVQKRTNVAVFFGILTSFVYRATWVCR